MSAVPLRRPSLGEVFDAHFSYVWISLRRLGVRESELEDQAHEVFLKVHTRLDDYDPGRPIRPWLFAFCVRLAGDYRRLARHRVEVLGAPLEGVASERPADARIEAAEERALLTRALDAIDLDRRAVLVMHEIDEVPIPAVAEALGIPVATAYSRLRQARIDFAATLFRLRKQRGDT